MRTLSYMLIISFTIAGTDVTAQCEDCPGELSGDGIVTNNDLLLWFANDLCTDEYDACIDINGDGVDDARDLFDLLQLRNTNYGTSTDCVSPLQASSSSFVQLHLVEWADIPTEECGLFDQTIPYGAKAYRLYAQLANGFDRVTGVYGTPEIPLEISTTSYFILDGDKRITPFSSYPLLYDFCPALEFRTYFAFGWPEVEESNYHVLDFRSCEPGVSLQTLLANQSSLETLGNYEFFWGFDPINAVPEEYHELWMLGQFATNGELSGIINIGVANGGLDHQTVYHEGLTFSSDNLSYFGCMDPEAANYLPEANLPGPCYYPGDVNEDGEFDTEDLISFMENFGCNADCGPSDLNGDGIVNNADLMILLQLLNCC